MKKYLIPFAAIFFFILLSIYSSVNYDKGYVSINQFKLNPEKYNNQLFEERGKITEITDKTFVFDYRAGKIAASHDNIDGIKQNINFGDYQILGRFKKDGSIEAVQIHHYDYIYFKYPVSAIAFIIFAFLFIKEWKLIKRGFKHA